MASRRVAMGFDYIQQVSTSSLLATAVRIATLIGITRGRSDVLNDLLQTIFTSAMYYVHGERMDVDSAVRLSPIPSLAALRPDPPLIDLYSFPYIYSTSARSKLSTLVSPGTKRTPNSSAKPTGNITDSRQNSRHWRSRVSWERRTMRIV